jgi:hypothetical protein
MTTKTLPQSRIKIGDREFAAEGLTLPAGDAREFRSAWVVNSGSVVEIDWEKARTDFRKTAVMPIVSFIMSAVKLGFLDAEDALSASKGEWPVSFNKVLAAMPPEDRLEAQVVWANITEVRRNAPLLILIGTVKEITPEQFDAMFGYAGQ